MVYRIHINDIFLLNDLAISDSRIQHTVINNFR